MSIRNNAAVPLQTFEAGISTLMVAIALIVISIYPNLQNAINRGKQKRMMAEMRAISEALESYHDDFKVYPAGNSTVENIGKELESYLEKEVPVKDEWGNQYIYISDGLTSYTIMSFGKDRVQDRSTTIYQGIVNAFENDIAYSNGLFVSFPEAVE